MKVIRVDNFDRDFVPEKLMVGGLSLAEAKILAETMNKLLSGPNSPDFYRVVGEDHVLYQGLEEETSAAEFGLPLTQEPKYTVNAAGRLISRATGIAIPDDEPVFILRAKDKHAWPALNDYLHRCQDEAHQGAVRSREQDFLKFAMAHLERMQEPTTEAGDDHAG